jgi:3'-phosphoadenosine 5'-phosphosulfate sulfotransferase (PAPS reductase)/FAD synthetase
MSDTIYLASISGGKDSAAMALHLKEQGIECRNVFFDTGWENPLVYEYIQTTLTQSIGPIEMIEPPLPELDPEQEALAIKYENSLGHKSAFIRLTIRKGMFPSRKRRWCTDYLKIKTLKKLLRPMLEDGLLPVNTVGIRASESKARAKLPEREISTSLDCMVWRPIITWSTQDVIDIHTRHGLAPNPLYLKGADRVGCWPCIFSRKSEVRFMAETDQNRIDLVRDLEADVGRLTLERYKRKGNYFSGALPTFFGQNGPSGDDMTTIDEMVQWSKTSFGGKQFNFFREDELEPSCMSWGLCDSGSE